MSHLPKSGVLRTMKGIFAAIFAPVYSEAALHSTQSAHVAIGQKKRPHCQGQDGPLCGYY